jgi:hypothetical protein
VETRYETGPKVIRWNGDDLLSVASDKVFHNWITKYEFTHLALTYSSYSVD